MEAGQKVAIYADPFTEQSPEGEAELLARDDRIGVLDGLEYWKMRFVGDAEDEVVYRWIRPIDPIGIGDVDPPVLDNRSVQNDGEHKPVLRYADEAAAKKGRAFQELEETSDSLVELLRRTKISPSTTAYFSHKRLLDLAVSIRALVAQVQSLDTVIDYNGKEAT